MSVTTLSIVSSEIAEINSKESVISQLKKKQSDTPLLKVNEDFIIVKQEDEKKDIIIVKQEDEKKDIVVKQEDEKKDIIVVKQEDEKKDIKIKKAIKQKKGEIKSIKVEIEDTKTANNIDSISLVKISDITKKELFELYKKLIATNKKLEQQNISYESLYCQQEEKIKKLQEENSLMKIHIENLNTELDGMDKTEKQFDGVTDIQCSHFHNGLKPDISVTEFKSEPTSSNVIIIGELKRVKLIKPHYEQ
ncbi:10957_t:CDS:2, partial [Scutellospora calospora]